MSTRKEPMPIQVIIATMRAAAVHLDMADREGSPKIRELNLESADRLRQAADDLASHLVAGIERTMVP